MTFYTGLVAAQSLGVLGSCSLRAVHVPLAEIERMDTQTQPYFEEAQQNIPSVVEELTGTKALCKICGLMVRDKLKDTLATQDYMSSVLEKPIIEPCRKSVAFYGCVAKENPNLFADTLSVLTWPLRWGALILFILIYCEVLRRFICKVTSLTTKGSKKWNSH